MSSIVFSINGSRVFDNCILCNAGAWVRDLAKHMKHMTMIPDSDSEDESGSDRSYCCGRSKTSPSRSSCCSPDEQDISYILDSDVRSVSSGDTDRAVSLQQTAKTSKNSKGRQLMASTTLNSTEVPSASQTSSSKSKG